MAWFMVIIAGIFEMGFAVLLKQSHGITRLWPTMGFAVCAVISFGLLSQALRHLEVGPAYAVWTGIGAAGTAIVGILALDESASTIKLTSIALILVGVIGLNLAGITRLCHLLGSAHGSATCRGRPPHPRYERERNSHADRLGSHCPDYCHAGRAARRAGRRRAA